MNDEHFLPQSSAREARNVECMTEERDLYAGSKYMQPLTQVPELLSLAAPRRALAA